MNVLYPKLLSLKGLEDKIINPLGLFLMILQFQIHRTVSVKEESGLFQSGAPSQRNVYLSMRCIFFVFSTRIFSAEFRLRTGNISDSEFWSVHYSVEKNFNFTEFRIYRNSAAFYRILNLIPAEFCCIRFG